MRRKFDPQRPIVVPVHLIGPAGAVVIRLLVDTGASFTIVAPHLLALVGVDQASGPSVSITTAAGVVEAVPVVVPRVSLFDQSRDDVAVLAHALPAHAPIDGLLGLDLLRSLRMIIDFRDSVLELS